MKYDSSMTLSENKKLISEQGGNYYTPSGDLIGYPGVNNVNIPATDVYPEIKNGNLKYIENNNSEDLETENLLHKKSILISLFLCISWKKS